MIEPRVGGRLLLATEAEPEGIEVEVPGVAAEHANSAAHFIHGIRTGAEFLPLCQDRICRDAQEILEAGRLSQEQGCEVSLPL